MTSSTVASRRTSARPARPLSPPKLPEHSPYPDEDEGVGLTQIVGKLFGFRSANSASTSSSGKGAGGLVGAGGSRQAGATTASPVEIGHGELGSLQQQSPAQSTLDGLSGRTTISHVDTLGLGRPSDATGSPSRAASARIASSVVPSPTESPSRVIPRLVTPSDAAAHALAHHAPSPLRTGFNPPNLEVAGSPVSSHSCGSAKLPSPAEEPAPPRPAPSQQSSTQSAQTASGSAGPRSVPLLSARFMQPAVAAPLTSVEAASGRATFSALESAQTSPQSQSRTRHTSTGSFSGALGSKVPHFMRPRRGSNASIISSTFRNNLGSPGFPSTSSFPWNNNDTGFTSVPGFPLAGPAGDSDNRSIRTTVSVKRNKSASKAIRKLVQGDILSKDYWMDDSKATACYDCGRTFTTFTRKHHCRICGSIFCGRCASNLLQASRFGADGTIRVCNLCLANLEEGSDDEDNRSPRSSRGGHFPFAPSIQLDGPHSLQRSLLHHQHQHHHHHHHHHHPQHGSPTLSGSPLAGHPELSLPGSLAVDRHFDSALSSRPLTPEERFAFLHSSESNFNLHTPTMEGIEDQAPLRPAPFRSTAAADDMEPVQSPPTDTTSRAMAACAGDEPHAIRFAPDLAKPDRSPPDRVPIVDGQPQSFMSFPTSEGGGADDELATPAHPLNDSGGSRFSRSNSQARFDSNAPIPSPLAGIRYQSKLGQSTSMLDDLLRFDGTTRPRASSVSEHSHAVVGHSLAHFRKILKEAIAREKLNDAAQWAETLEKLLVQVAESVRPNVKAGDDLDLRTYVKLKKVPGGRIQDSEYLDGVAITKHVAHKKMMPDRVLKNPRIMVLTLPLEYHRVEGQYVALTPVMAQERDYLRSLVQRIAAQRPHIVLASSPVSRLALEGLLAANIAVARSVKPTALAAVKRSTQAEDISSMDRLALEPKLGRCSTLRLTTFDHNLIPGRRKTLMRFEGCHKQFGCTLILRGGDLETLRKVKSITSFMVYTIYHLKLEMFLWHDAFGIPPPEAPRPAVFELPDITIRSEYLTDHESSPASAALSKMSSPGHISAVTAASRDRLHFERGLSRRIYDRLRPYLEVTLSVSTSVAIPPPFPLAKMSKLDNTLHLLREARYEEEARVILREEQKTILTGKNPLNAAELPSAVLESPPVGLGLAVQPSSQDLFSPIPPAPPASSDLDLPPPRTEGARASPLPPLPSLDSILHSPEVVAQISALGQIENEHAAQATLWEWYQSRYTHSLLPEENQSLRYLAAEGCGDHGHCVAPHLHEVHYYQHDDQTLGQWIDGKVGSAYNLCNCGKPKLEHYELLTHAETRLQIAMERCPVPVEEGKTMTWTYCLLCDAILSKAYLSEQSWKMSFGKFLETSFYPNPQRMPMPGCPHDFVRSHVRYFIRRDCIIRIHNEAVENFEVILPSSRSFARAETKLLLKNAEITACFQASNLYFDSLGRKLHAFDAGLVDPTRVNDLRLKLGNFIDQVEVDRREILTKLADGARTSSPTDVLAINPILMTLQGIVVRWDEELAELEKAFFPTERDVRRIAEGRIRRMFAGTDGLSSERGGSSIRSATVSEVDETEDTFGTEESDSNGSSAQSLEKWNEDTSIPLASLTPSPGLIDLPSTSSLLNEAGPSSPPPLPPPTSSSSSVDDTVTPMNTGFRLPRPADHDDSYFPTLSLTAGTPIEDSASGAVAEGEQADSTNDSDSTISAVPTSLKPMSILSSVMTGLTPHDEEVNDQPSSSPPPSRIPRITKINRTASKVATLVQRFQQREGDEQLGDDEEDDQDLKAYRSLFKSTSVPRPADSHTESEQELEAQPRPKIRRGATEGSLRKKRASTGRTLSDQTPGSSGDSRLPLPKARATSPKEQTLSSPGPTKDAPQRERGKRVASGATLVPDRPSREANDNRSATSQASPRAAASRAKPRIAGKASISSPAAQARQRAGGGGSSRVSTITRHFDRLSREAERDRQKRLTLARGRRARPVTVAKAVVTSLDLRDAVRDESDSDLSSEADDEEEDGSPFKMQQGKRARHASPASPTTSPLAHRVPITHPLQALDAEVASTSPSNTPPFSTGGVSSVQQASSPPKASQDAVQLDLGPFEKLAPLSSMPPTPLMTGGSSSTPQSGGVHGGHVSESEMSSAGPERNSILKTLSSLWAFTDANLAPLEYPLASSSHLFKDARIIMREEEPLSIIAYALDSPLYKDRLKALQAEAANTSPRAASLSASVPADTSQEWTMVGHSDAQEHETAVVEGDGSHLQIVVNSGSTSLFCNTIFLERFENLRARCGLSGANGFIESLARCVKWENSGGKSKSAFLKTRDDRFVAKELSKQEMDDFSKFAPAYFKYMADCLDKQQPTALAKIFGVYKIGYTSPQRGALRMNVMIMENLFHDKRFQVIYDLKGNQRGRHIEPSGKPGEVLLDANLEKTLWNHPLYLRDYSKTMFRSALHNDTKFLADHGVMDYSVVCAVDQSSSEITAGIIDYIRTFTWDKKLESWVKDSAFFPSKGTGEPTIVGPKQYKNRFRASMEKYLTVIPDFWMRKDQLEAPEDLPPDGIEGVPPTEEAKLPV